LPLEEQQGWYDYAVQAGEWMRRFAGRLETGRHGISDPAMGS
jgi:phospholipase C